uniref:Uncharacterized protein n=1 Tax=Thermosphaera aggregans TaxID=54254 RepID=A0A7C2BLC7_9CREN
MRKKTIGALLMFSTTVFMGFYTYLLFFSNKQLQEVTLKITIYSLVLIFTASLFLIGYGFFKTPTITPQEVREKIKNIDTGSGRPKEQ